MGAPFKLRLGGDFRAFPDINGRLLETQGHQTAY